MTVGLKKSYVERNFHYIIFPRKPYRILVAFLTMVLLISTLPYILPHLPASFGEWEFLHPSTRSLFVRIHKNAASTSLFCNCEIHRNHNNNYNYHAPSGFLCFCIKKASRSFFV